MKRLALLLTALLVASLCAAQTSGGLSIRADVPSGLPSQLLPVLTTADLAEVSAVLGRAPASGLIAGTETVGGQPRAILGQINVVGRQVRIALALPSLPAGTRLVRLLPGATPPAAPGMPVRVAQDGGKITITNGTYQITHDPGKNGGLPSRIVFPQTGKVFQNFSFNDRVYEPAAQGFQLRDDRAPEVTLLAAGPLYAEVQVKARYLQGEKAAPGNPHATYNYSYFAGQPTVHLTGQIAQEGGFSWNELHFWELFFQDDAFTQWAANDQPLAPFKDEAKTYHGGQWGALLDGRNAIGLLGSAMIHDGKNDYGRYLHGPWVSWGTPHSSFSLDVWIGAAADPAAEIATAAAAKLRVLPGTLYTPELLQSLAKLEARCQADPRLGWLLSLLQSAIQQHAVSLAEADKAARALLAGKPQATLQLGGQKLQLCQTPTLGMALPPGCGQIVSLYDLRRGRELLAAPSPLFQVELRSTDGATRSLQSTQLRPLPGGTTAGNALKLRFDLGATDQALAGIVVSLRGALVGDETRWQVDVDNSSTTWSLMKVSAPLLQVNTMGADAADDQVLFPAGYGKAYPVLSRPREQGWYPSGWCTMQWMAVTDETGGLYLGFHDPTAAYKILHANEVSGTGVPLSFEVPAPDATVPGNDYHPAGDLVIAAVGGGYYPACRLYRAWLDKHAPWWPEPGKYARSDYAKWVTDTQIWVEWGAGAADQTVPPTKAFAEAMAAPTALHWYCWHEIPFDNQYPHYFPTRPGFRDGVKALQDAGVHVMPYINGRLWDKDTDDFPTQALPNCTKNDKLEPYIERYGSGRDLVPMCPYTAFWQAKVQEIVVRLMGEEGVDGVYTDQVAAAGPAPCYDKTHGHPLGGGHWWVDGYWKMLTELKQKIARISPAPDGRRTKMLTTESNAEPYAKYYDAYLMCNDNSSYNAPLFPCVYGGKIQMFGTYMARDDWNDVTLMALRQGKLFAYGTQLWWSDPNVVSVAEAKTWLHDLVQLRTRVSEFFVRGQMAAPPALAQRIGYLTTKWAPWGPDKVDIHTPDLWATTWRLESGRLLMPLVNVPRQARTVTLRFDPATYGLKPGAEVRVERVTPTGVTETLTKQGRFSLPVKLGPAEATALLITPL